MPITGPLLGLFWLLGMAAGTAGAAPWFEPEGTPEQSGRSQRDAALVVGIEDYTFLPDIPGAEATSEAWYRFFIDSLEIPDHQVTLLQGDEATGKEINRALVEAAIEVGRGGTLWFVFLGHGAYPRDGLDRMLLGREIRPDPDSVERGGLPVSTIEMLLNMGEQVRSILVWDTNLQGVDRAGESLVPALPRLIPAYPLVLEGEPPLLLASRGREPPPLLPGEQRPAMGALLAAALRGWGDRNTDGQVTVHEAVSYARFAASAVYPDLELQPRIEGDVAGIALSRAQERGPDLAEVAWQEARNRVAARHERLERAEAAARAEAQRSWADVKASPVERRLEAAQRYLRKWRPASVSDGEATRWFTVPQAESAYALVQELRGDREPAREVRARAVQLLEEMRRRSERNVWRGVDDAYRDLQALEGYPGTAEAHLLGAQAARALGQPAEVRQRLVQAAGEDPTAEVLEWLASLETRYGPVEMDGVESFEPREVPLAPDQRAAIEHAQEQVAQAGRLDGLLPAGLYELGQGTLLVVPGEAGRVVPRWK